jgi:hypothetical protein
MTLWPKVYLHGESENVCNSGVLQDLNQLPILLWNYKPKDIYNMEEMGLLYIGSPIRKAYLHKERWEERRLKDIIGTNKLGFRVLLGLLLFQVSHSFFFPTCLLLLVRVLEHGLFLCPHCALRLSHFIIDNLIFLLSWPMSLTFKGWWEDLTSLGLSTFVAPCDNDLLSQIMLLWEWWR